MPYELLEQKILLIRRTLLPREWCDFRGYNNILGDVILFLLVNGTPRTSNNTYGIIIYIWLTQSKWWCQTTNKNITATRTRTVGLMSLQDLILQRALMVLRNRNATAKINDVCIMWTRNDYRSRSNTHTMLVVTDTSTISWTKTASDCDVSLRLNNRQVTTFIIILQLHRTVPNGTSIRWLWIRQLQHIVWVLVMALTAKQSLCPIIIINQNGRLHSATATGAGGEAFNPTRM